MKNLIVLLAITIFFRFGAFASNPNYKHRIAICGALSTEETWKREVSYHYMLSSYCGIGASLGHWSQFFGERYLSGSGWHIDEEDEKVANYYICPSIHIETPTLIKINASRIVLFVEPGCQVSTPIERVCIKELDNPNTYKYKYIKGKNPNFLDLQIKVCIALRIKTSCEMAIGYTYSTMDIYSTRRKLKYKGSQIGNYYLAAEKMHEALLSFCIMF